MALMLVATGTAHFTSTDLMVEMMPESLPAKRGNRLFYGICALLAVIGLLWNKTAKLTSVMLIIFFLAILPANIVGSIKEVRLGGMENGTAYLLFRIPLQIFFILWVYYFGIKISREK